VPVVPRLRYLTLILTLSVGIFGATNALAADPAPAGAGPGGLWSLYPLGTRTGPSATVAAESVAAQAAAGTPAASAAQRVAASTATSTDSAGGPGSRWWVFGALIAAAVVLVATAVPSAKR
jgi:hypothetical protein